MKNFLIATLLLVAMVVRGEDFVFSPDSPNVASGVSLNWYQESPNFTWTNTAVLPWYPESIVVFENSGTTNVIELKAIRIYDSREQIPPSTVITNIFGELETNVYWQVTNETYRVSTTVVFSASVIGDRILAMTNFFNYKAEDLLRLSMTYTNSGTGFILNGKR